MADLIPQNEDPTPAIAVHTPKPTNPTSKLWIAGILCAVLAVIAYRWSRVDPLNPNGVDFKPHAADVSKDESSDQQALRDLIEKHLQKAEEQTLSLSNQGYPAIEVLFSKAYDNVPEFSKSILGWKSKWNLVLDKLPGNDQDRHEKYLKDQFQRLVLSPEQLDSAVRQSVRERLLQVRDIENQMLIEIRADIAGLPELEQIQSMGTEAFETRFEQALSQASEVVSDDLSSTIESQLVSLVAGEVMAQVAVRMGVSAGVLSTGAASGWATFGVGLVAGVVVDQIVTRIWDWWSEPEVELSFQISKQLAMVHDLICKGDSKSSGLDGRFQQWNSQRNQIRRLAILNVFFPDEVQNALPKTQS